MGGKFKQKGKPAPTSRKELRKKMRKEKKAKKNNYFKSRNKTVQPVLGKHAKNKEASKQDKLMRNNVSKAKVVKVTGQCNVSHSALNKSKVDLKPKSTFLDEQNKLHREEIKEKAKLERGMANMRKKILLEANEKEDKEIKKLEKYLKLNKNKSKSIPKSFADEGLDYVLEICDSDKIMAITSGEKNLEKCDSEFEDDFALVTGKRKKQSSVKEKQLPAKKKKTNEFGRDKSLSDNEFEESEEIVKNSLGSDNDVSGTDIDQNSDTEIEDESMDEDNNCEVENGDEAEEVEEELDDDIKGVGSEDISENKSDNDDGETNSDSINEDKIGEMDDGKIKNENKEENCEDSQKNKKQKDGVWEDIYGRMRDKTGSIIQSPAKGKYIPPQLRAQQLGEDAKKSEELARLKKQLKGLVNRLAESNIHSIANQIDELYMQNSRNDMNDCLLSLITNALVAPVLTAERLVMEHTLLITVLHANVGMEVGAHFVESFVKRFQSMYQEGQDVENKELDNILLTISHLYHFKVFNAVLMYNILNQLIEKFSEKEVELILLVLRSVGFTLRKDDPLALKDLVLRLQKKASEATHLRDNTRVRFMLDILLAVKNNNMSKIPQYDPSLGEHLKKLLKSLVRKGKYVTELKVTLDDLLKVEERGRWWIVGSAWSGTSTNPAPNATALHPSTEGLRQFSQPLLELARKQRMNTDTRRNTFCILMSAEDYLDAFEKLLRLGLKGQQESEIFHVIVHCLLREKRYNPYYAHLASHFCQADRKYQMTIQYHLWDKFKELSSMSQSQITNLAKFLAHLFLEKALPISALKVLQFTEMDKSCVRLLRQVLLSLLMCESEDALLAVFARVSRPEKLHMFRESLRLFLHHFVLRNVSDLRPDQALLLKYRVKLAEKALISVDAHMFL